MFVDRCDLLTGNIVSMTLLPDFLSINVVLICQEHRRGLFCCWHHLLDYPEVVCKEFIWAEVANGFFALVIKRSRYGCWADVGINQFLIIIQEVRCHFCYWVKGAWKKEKMISGVDARKSRRF